MSSAYDVLAASRPASESGGLIAFAVVAALFVAAWLLYRSLRHQLAKIDINDPEQRGPATPTAGPDSEA